MRQDYDINGVHVWMTAGQAKRWNGGNTTAADLRSAQVVILESTGYRQISLRRACNPRLEPLVAASLAGHHTAALS